MGGGWINGQQQKNEHQCIYGAQSWVNKLAYTESTFWYSSIVLF